MTTSTYVKKLSIAAASAALSFAVNESTAQAVSFNFSPESGTSQEVINALNTGGELWSSIFTDDVTLDIGFRFSMEPPGAASTLLDFSYELVRDALFLDQTSSADFSTVSTLQSAPALEFLINLTSDNPNGFGSPIAYLDNDGSSNNTTIRMTASNAKALGLDRADAMNESIFLGGDPSRDAVVILDPFGIGGMPWDFDRSDGISEGAIDFTGIVAHELGHVLGFSSGVDILDRSSFVQSEDQLLWVNTLDLFRFSEDSIALGEGVFDWTANTTDKFFSIDGGTNRIASFSTGIFNGDGKFPGHWKSLGTGIMDNTLTPFIGQEAQISSTDIVAIDVIGWNVTDSTSVPEPTSTLALLALGTYGVGSTLLRQQKQKKSVINKAN